MGKIRIYKLAKELEVSSSDLLDILHDLDVEVSSHMSTIKDETAALIRGMYNDQNEEDNDTGQEDKQITKQESKQEENKVIDKKTVEESKGKEDINDGIEVEVPITVKELAEVIKIPANKIIKQLMGLGLMANVNHPLDEDTLIMLGDEMGINIILKTISKEEVREADIHDRVCSNIEEKEEDLKLRPPIVTVMGHVDHGKTTLLDVISESRVAEGEAGGITQHIGAYQVRVHGKKITFIDTPGHEAFTAMRARGAQVTDITILVVAADDGVMPQTIEAINHAKAADIPIIVAINKIDKPNAQPDRVKQELTEHGLVPEDWGGQTICVPLSALKGENIEELLEMILLVSEIEEVKANPKRLAEGVVIESELDKGRGPVATVLIKNGTMRIGDALLAGPVSGRVRAMIDDKENRVKKATPSMPIEILGFSDVPNAGDLVQVLTDEREARQVAGARKSDIQKRSQQNESKISLEDLYQQIQEGQVKELNIIVKADVHGSIEALRDSFLKLGNEEVSVNIIHTGVGAINEHDIYLASASNAVILGFNVRPDKNARLLGEKEGIDIRTYRVIYKAIEELKDSMSGLLDPELKEEVTGRAEIRDTFKVPKIGLIAGLYVTDGIINRNDKVRLLRDNVVIYEGEIGSLKRFENDVREVREGYECGLGIEGYNDIKIGDELEIYTIREIERSL